MDVVGGIFLDGLRAGRATGTAFEAFFPSGRAGGGRCDRAGAPVVVGCGQHFPRNDFGAAVITKLIDRPAGFGAGWTLAAIARGMNMVRRILPDGFRAGCAAVDAGNGFYTRSGTGRSRRDNALIPVVFFLRKLFARNNILAAVFAALECGPAGFRAGRRFAGILRHVDVIRGILLNRFRARRAAGGAVEGFYAFRRAGRGRCDCAVIPVVSECFCADRDGKSGGNRGVERVLRVTDIDDIIAALQIGIRCGSGPSVRVNKSVDRFAVRRLQTPFVNAAVRNAGSRVIQTASQRGGMHGDAALCDVTDTDGSDSVRCGFAFGRNDRQIEHGAGRSGNIALRICDAESIKAAERGRECSACASAVCRDFDRLPIDGNGYDRAAAEAFCAPAYRFAFFIKCERSLHRRFAEARHAHNSLRPLLIIRRGIGRFDQIPAVAFCPVCAG